jgi:hypothetical protein
MSGVSPSAPRDELVANVIVSEVVVLLDDVPIAAVAVSGSGSHATPANIHFFV